jgi:hypothetical protein
MKKGGQKKTKKKKKNEKNTRKQICFMSPEVFRDLSFHKN